MICLLTTTVINYLISQVRYRTRIEMLGSGLRRCIEAMAALLPDQQLQGLLLLSILPGQFDARAAADVLGMSVPASIGMLQVSRLFIS
jgi:hypothetical protein